MPVKLVLSRGCKNYSQKINFTNSIRPLPSKRERGWMGWDDPHNFSNKISNPRVTINPNGVGIQTKRSNMLKKCHSSQLYQGVSDFSISPCGGLIIGGLVHVVD
jgi:hypothetical protein